MSSNENIDVNDLIKRNKELREVTMELVNSKDDKFLTKYDLELFASKLENSLEKRFNEFNLNLEKRFNKIDLDVHSIRWDLKWHWWVILSTLGISTSGLCFILKILFEILEKMPK